MTKRKPKPPAPPAPLPTQGGSFLRDPDGTLRPEGAAAETPDPAPRKEDDA
jgi:hypothetical protein